MNTLDIIYFALSLIFIAAAAYGFWVWTPRVARGFANYLDRIEAWVRHRD